MGEVVRLDRSNDSMLKDFLSGCPNATIYHTPLWRDVLIETYGYEPFWLGYVEEGKLRSLLPLMLVRSRLTGNRLVSLPFSNVCGPCGETGHFETLVSEAISLCHDLRTKALEIRTQDGLNHLDDGRFTNLCYFVTSIVPLDPDPEIVWRRFKDRNVRTEVRQAIKKGVTVRMGGESKVDMQIFYGLYVKTRLRHGVPPQPFAFFRNLYRIMYPEHLDIYLAHYAEKPVGGLINLNFGETTNTAYIGSDITYRKLRIHQLLFWKSMENGCRQGFKKFDFLRTPKNSQSQRYFKQRWNAYEVDLNYLYYPEIKGTAATIEETAKYRLLTTVLKRSPTWLGVALGRLLYRHLG